MPTPYRPNVKTEEKSKIRRKILRLFGRGDGMGLSVGLDACVVSVAYRYQGMDKLHYSLKATSAHP